MVELLQFITPSTPGRDTEAFDNGVEWAKDRILNILAKDLGPEIKHHGARKLAEKLNGRS